MKNKVSLIIVILLMSIGFASISTTLIIRGNANVKENVSDFEIIFTKSILDNVDVYESVVSEDKQTITFTSNDLKKLNDTSILNYEVTNNSSNYDAEVVINCNVKDGESAEYTSITNSLEDNKTIISAKESVNGTLTIKLEKASTVEITERYTCTLKFNAVERDSLAYNGPYEWTFLYTGSEQEFIVPINGTYKLETWGAQGGTERGGYGGYSAGKIYLSKNELIYINVGGQGSDQNGMYGGTGGYNGGGAGGNARSSSYYGGSGGGGATHIAKISGLLSTLESYKSSILIISGGGGGVVGGNGWVTSRLGGSGGGIVGMAGAASANGKSYGGTQTEGYLFGLGSNGRNGDGSSEGGEGNGGSGSGLYGGYSSITQGIKTNVSGGGGSGYIGNSNLTEKSMYCYNCTESEEESTKTISTTCVSETPTENCSKIGNGYVRISLIV